MNRSQAWPLPVVWKAGLLLAVTVWTPRQVHASMGTAVRDGDATEPSLFRAEAELAEASAPQAPTPLEVSPAEGDAAATASGCPQHCLPGTRDSDRDGLPDRVERRTGTLPYRADTDADGIPDGMEDANRDGVVDPGESDPRVPGLFPGGSPHIPEPLLFDLVRGLGAKQGEVETNTLLVARFPRRGAPGLAWAPEVEWALYDGVAVEVELPMQDRELEAFKSAFQVTLPQGLDHFTHGVQVIAEYLIGPREFEGTALYVAGARSGPASVLSMLGARGVFSERHQDLDLLLNASAFWDLNENLTAGSELNVALVSMSRTHLVLVPQVHWQISRRVRVQLGAGAAVSGALSRSTVPAAFSRVVLE